MVCDRTCKWLIITIIPFSLIYIIYSNFRVDILVINGYHIVKKTSTTTSSSISHPMFEDPEANTCYALKSMTMPEEMIDLNAIAVGHQALSVADAPAKVTFKQVHHILYGNVSSKLIYRYARKYLNKQSDRSFPLTFLTKDAFISIIEKIDPTLKLQFVVEVGSLTGMSATLMGNVLKKSYPGAFLLCIDTWLGDLNMWVNKAVWEYLSVTEDGRPTVYYQFLANIIEQNLTRTILPASMTSIAGARFLQTFKFRPQLIYLDAAHEQGETLIELALYWHILRPGGVLCGDDWIWLSVRCDVKKFMYMRNLTIEHLGKTWVLKKSLDAL